ncbi:Uma2 family endonuclease [Embleya hyalina]|uniref:Uma2 family endonuclease n=1 Tax=Embleya hyalina TaxID=516124 RepID=UPI0013598332|nr:Uma2 family endonuclease [Embleya hyalina]
MSDEGTETDPLAKWRLAALRILRASDEFPEAVRWEASPSGLVMQASPDWEHARIVTGLRHLLEPRLPAEVVVLEGVAFLVGIGTERTPDLVVVDTRKTAEFRDGHATSASGVWMFVEVTSNSTRRVDLREKPHEFARADVPVMLTVDRQEHDVIVRFGPVDGRYTFTERVKAGASVMLPEPFDATVETGFLLDHL